MKLSLRALAGALLFVAPAALGIGCAARLSGGVVATSDGDDVVVADVAPLQIETYPHYYYAGADVYYVNGRYYRRNGANWVYYRHAPRELERRRAVVHEHVAPRRDAPYNAEVHDRR